MPDVCVCVCDKLAMLRSDTRLMHLSGSLRDHLKQAPINSLENMSSNFPFSPQILHYHSKCKIRNEHGQICGEDRAWDPEFSMSIAYFILLKVV